MQTKFQKQKKILLRALKESQTKITVSSSSKNPLKDASNEASFQFNESNLSKEADVPSSFLHSNKSFLSFKNVDTPIKKKQARLNKWSIFLKSTYKYNSCIKTTEIKPKRKDDILTRKHKIVGQLPCIQFFSNTK